MSANIYHPSRGGVRGGRDQFNWEDVKEDKDRENYLGWFKLMSATQKFHSLLNNSSKAHPNGSILS